jgi:hypothetical protein
MVNNSTNNHVLLQIIERKIDHDNHNIINLLLDSKEGQTVMLLIYDITDDYQ